MSWVEEIQRGCENATETLRNAFQQDQIGHDELRSLLIQAGNTPERAEEIVNEECDAKD